MRTVCKTTAAATADAAPFAFCAALACFLAFFSEFFNDCTAAQALIWAVSSLSVKLGTAARLLERGLIQCCSKMIFELKYEQTCCNRSYLFGLLLPGNDVRAKP